VRGASEGIVLLADPVRERTGSARSPAPAPAGVSHVDDLLADPAARLLAGMAVLRKKSALTDYSCRLSHDHQRNFLAALDKNMIGAGLASPAQVVFDLDFHAVMHWGHDPALESTTCQPGPDLDIMLCVLPRALLAAMRARLPGYAAVSPSTIQRRFLETPGQIITSADAITIRLERRAYSPVLRKSQPPRRHHPLVGGRTVRCEIS